MSDKTNVFSLADFKRKETNNVKYTTVEAYGGTVRLGSVSARDMLDWIAGNQDETKKRLSGARLIVKSLVDEDGNRVPESEYDAYVDAFLEKDHQENNKVARAVLDLNGFGDAKKDAETAKNGSSEVPAAASPSA